MNDILNLLLMRNIPHTIPLVFQKWYDGITKRQQLFFYVLKHWLLPSIFACLIFVGLASVLVSLINRVSFAALDLTGQVCTPSQNPAAQPVVTQPVINRPAGAAQPVVTQPVITRAPAQPVVTQPVITGPTVAQPVVTQPLITRPATAQPLVTQPVITRPAATQPVITRPAPSLQGAREAQGG